MPSATMGISEQVRSAIATLGDAAALEFQGRSITGDELASWERTLCALLKQAAVPTDAAAALISRNRPLHAGTIIALAAQGQSLSNIYAIQSPGSIAAELANLKAPVVIADACDWHPEIRAAVAALGGVGIMLDHSGDSYMIRFVDGLDHLRDGNFREPLAEPGLEILSSGTTGPPKRILLPFRIMERFVATAKAASGPDAGHFADVVIMPFSGIGGASAVIANVILGRTTVLLEKFAVAPWVEAVERHKPAYVTIPPAAIRMILDAKIAPERMASIRFVTGGGAKMEPALQEEFETRYGAAILWGYGATEFAGTLACWTPELHARYRQTKSGAVGRLLPGVSARIVDPDTGRDVGKGMIGLIEARVPLVRPDWIRTTDLGLIDEDGFLFHHGRADGAIVRGGFKVMPEKIIAAMRLHPMVQEIGVVGIPDRRLGQVPVAVIQLSPDGLPPPKAELIAHARQHLVAHHVPENILFVPELPRTLTMKVDQAALAAMVADLLQGMEGDHG